MNSRVSHSSSSYGLEKSRPHLTLQQPHQPSSSPSSQPAEPQLLGATRALTSLVSQSTSRTSPGHGWRDPTNHSQATRVLRERREEKMDRHRYRICSRRRGQGRYSREAVKMEIIGPTAAIILLAQQKVSPGAPSPRVFKDKTLQAEATSRVTTAWK